MLKTLGALALLGAVTAQGNNAVASADVFVGPTGDDCECNPQTGCAKWTFAFENEFSVDLLTCSDQSADAIQEAMDFVQTLNEEQASDDIGQLMLQLEVALKAQMTLAGRSNIQACKKEYVDTNTACTGDAFVPLGEHQCDCTCGDDGTYANCRFIDASSSSAMGELSNLKRFKNLKAMVMTMQPPSVTVFGRYCYYGCWCLPNGQHNLAAGYGQPVDPIDEVCKEFALCYKCLDMDFAGSCQPEKRSYRWGRVKDGFGVTYDLMCKDNPDQGPNHRCKRYTCECDRVLAMGLGATHMFWNESHHARWGGFDREASCETDCVGCIPQDDCCGAYGAASTDSPNPMTRRPYASTNPNSGCCQDVFYYNTIAQDCCVDGATVSVVDQGTCPGTVVDPDEIDDFDDTFPGYTRK